MMQNSETTAGQPQYGQRMIFTGRPMYAENMLLLVSSTH